MSYIYDNVAGAILAGGQSGRIGYPKAFLRLGGRRVLDMVLEVLRLFFNEILIIVSDKRDHFNYGEGVKVFEDLIKGCGPLGGIYTGLKHSSKEKVFIVGCDMPFLHIGLIERLLTAAREGDSDCIIPYSDKGIEPLHAIYSKTTLPGFKASLVRKDFAIRRAFSCFNCKYIEAKPEELISFFNINTPEELALIDCIGISKNSDTGKIRGSGGKNLISPRG